MNRRRFLAGCGAALVAGACSDGGGPAADPDLDLAAEAAGVEKLAYDHYVGTGLAATEGRLGALLPPAVTTQWASAAGQHRQAHDRWNDLLAGAGRRAVSSPRHQVRDALNAAAARVNDIPAAVTLALRLEDYACRLYQRALPELRRPEAVTVAAQVAIVGHQRQAVYRYLLGLDPVAGAPTDLSLRVFTG